MKTILILNGPNLNMLGTREPEIYGYETLHDVERQCNELAQTLNVSIDFRQSNYEGELVSWIQEEKDNILGLIINAAAYTHTSIAIHDALKLLSVPIIEVHISDPAQRESFRHGSFISSLATSVIAGKGTKGYLDALTELSDSLS